MKATIYTIVLIILNFMACSLYAQQGTLDSTFNGNGIQLLSPSSSHDNGYATAVQPDSSIVFAGMATVNSSTGFDICVGRLHPDGTLDSTFGTNGYVIYDHNGKSDYGYDVDLQPDGKIVVTGAVSVTTANTEFFVMRLNTNGSYDTTFGGTGKVALTYSGGEDYARKGLIQSDGKIVLCGYTIVSSIDHATLIRLNSDGTLDSTFGTAGYSQSNFQMQELKITNIIRRANGNYVCVGTSTNTSLIQAGHAFAFTSNGIEDSVFGIDGIIALTGMTSGAGIVEHNNIFYACGTGGTSNSPVGYIYALNDSGNYIPSFGTGGRIIVTLNQGVGYNAIAVQQDGKIIAGGGSLVGSFQGDFIISRFNISGTTDNTFGTNGHFIADLGNNTSQNLLDLAIQPNGKIIGYGTKMVNNYNDMAFVRLDASSSSAGIADQNDYINTINVYPNPASDNIQIALPAYVKVINVEIVAASGAISHIKMNSSNNISLRDFCKGIYVLKIQTADKIYTSKFAIE